MNLIGFRLIVFIVPSFLALGFASAADLPSAADDALFERLDSDDDGQVAAGEVSSEHGRLFTRMLRQGDTNGDKSLSRDEFVAALVPTRPEKPLDEKQPSSFPQADAIRWVLLTMDTSGNGSIDREEVPPRLQRVFDTMVKRIDGDKNGVIDRRELYQGGRQLSQIAGRYVQNEGIDTAAELRKLEKKLGDTAKRFDGPPPRFDNLGNPEQARQLFAQLDGNRNGQIENKEVTGPFERPIQRLMRTADFNGDGRLSEREFLSGARQIARRQARQDSRPKPTSTSMPATEESVPSNRP